MNTQQRITSFSNDGLEFDVIDTGPLAGDIVVLLHGWPQTAKCWEEVSRIGPALYRLDKSISASIYDQLCH